MDGPRALASPFLCGQGTVAAGMAVAVGRVLQLGSRWGAAAPGVQVSAGLGWAGPGPFPAARPVEAACSVLRCPGPCLARGSVL